MVDYPKEHEVLQLDSGPWWGSIGAMAVHHSHDTDHSSGQLNHTEAKQGECGAGIGHSKGVETHLTVTWADGQIHQPPPRRAPSPIYHTWLEIGYSPSMISAKYPHEDQSYKLLSTYGTQVGGRIMLPLSLATDEGPIFVNAKQYHGIMRRRQSRAKAELLNKALRARKPYMHESRHLHAKRRARGAGGRFLNSTKSLNDAMKEEEEEDHIMKKKEIKGKEDHYPAHPTGSDQDSDVLQSDINRYPNSKEIDISNLYFHGDFSFFQIGIPQHSLPNDCCNLKI